MRAEPERGMVEQLLSAWSTERLQLMATEENDPWKPLLTVRDVEPALT